MEETVDAPEVKVQPSAEDRAASLGWVPRDEWRGDPERWTDAEAFIAKGEQVLPILRENNKRLEQKVANLEKFMHEAIEHKVREREHVWKEKHDALKAEKKEALENADYDRVVEIDEDIDQLKAVKKAHAAAPQQPPPEVVSFLERNKSWFGNDADMTADARMFSDQYRRTNPDKSVAEELAYVEKKMKKDYPEHFQAHKSGTPPAVEGGGARLPKGGKGFDGLPAEAKEMFTRFVSMGLYQGGAEGRKQYAKGYQWD